MKYFLYLLIALSSSGCLGQANYEKELINSKWIAPVSKECIDFYIFKSKQKVLFYSCELADTTYGTYKFSNDTLVIREDNPSEGNVIEKWRFKFLMKKNLMYPISSEQLYNKTWKIQKVNANKDYIFKKTNSE
ncbi:MAG: hypothetical protein KGM16_19980 [Bacteroidota bacterium]|nr:hypothetical protein [Bacteroidota bacterium]